MDKQYLVNLQNRIAQYRGVIIHDIINIEGIIDSLIINYFVKEKKSSEFLNKVISDEYFSLGLKIRILEKMNFEFYKGFFEDIHRINNIRNLFAHNIPTLDEGFTFYNKDKKIHETKKMNELYKDFSERIKKVDGQLNKIFWKLVEDNKK